MPDEQAGKGPGGAARAGRTGTQPSLRHPPQLPASAASTSPQADPLARACAVIIPELRRQKMVFFSKSCQNSHKA